MLLTVPFDPDRGSGLSTPPSGQASSRRCRARAPERSALRWTSCAVPCARSRTRDGERRGPRRVSRRRMDHCGGRRTVCLARRSRSAAAAFRASVASAFTAWGALLYLAPPVILLSEGSRHETLRAIGLTAGAGVRSIALGAGHGHVSGRPSPDLGVADVRLRGAGVERRSVPRCRGVRRRRQRADRGVALQGRRVLALVAAMGVLAAAAACRQPLAVGRYLADPALPHAIEVSDGRCVLPRAAWLRRLCAPRAGAGSLLPGYLAAVTFFAAYRMLGQ